jgi:hypothetical protein
MKINIRFFTKYFAFSLFGFIAICTSIVRLTGASSLKNFLEPGVTGEILLKALLIIFIGFYIQVYIGISKKWFVKTPSRIDVRSYLKYTLVWGLLYSGLGLLTILILVQFFFLLLWLPGVAAAYREAAGYLSLNKSICLVFPGCGLLAGNIGYFYYGFARKKG